MGVVSSRRPASRKVIPVKKTLVTACASLALVAGTSAVAPTAASAATTGCVTQSEYKKAKKGMTPKQVAKIFGTKGKRDARAESGGYVSELRSYRTCSKYSAVAIMFSKKPGTNLRLSHKSAIWVY